METGITLRVLLLVCAAVILLETVAGYFASLPAVPVLAAIGLARLADALVIVAALVLVGRGLSSIGLASGTVTRGLKRGLAWSGFFMGLALMAWAILMILGVDPIPFLRMTLPSTTSGLVLAVLAAGLIGPVAEEMFFRGVIFGFFRTWGFQAALAVSSLLFAAAHMLTVPMPVTQLLGGIVLAAIYEREKNLMVPIVVHVVGNMTIMLISLT